MSPRNSAAAVVHMMEKTKCRRVITTHHSLGSLIDGIKADFLSKGTEMAQPQIDEIPALKDLYPSLIRGSQIQAFVSYPPPTSRPSEDDVLFYVHSSGSTGFPKPISLTNLNAKHRCLARKSRSTSSKQADAKWHCVSMHSRTQEYHDTSPRQCCVLAIVPYSWYSHSADFAYRFPHLRVHLPAHIFT